MRKVKCIDCFDSRGCEYPYNQDEKKYDTFDELTGYDAKNHPQLVFCPKLNFGAGRWIWAYEESHCFEPRVYLMREDY